MKFILILVYASLTLFAANAEDAAFALDFEEDYKTALSKAKKSNKPLMLVVVQDPCPYCDSLVEETLSDANVKKELEGFVSVIIDKKGNLPEEFRVRAVPMTFFINPRIEKSTYKNLGFLDAEDFTKMLKHVKSLSPKKIK
ncbi:thioredoxin family protein [Sulfurimonas sp. MAG313]|nr:thioredoxin family protein [Sulfurimonas sp. MAG313]MDF1880968.1 thioredoxin family protein [Sulfurimonas sp. MAG313]